MESSIIKPLNFARKKDRLSFINVLWNLYDSKTTAWAPPLKIGLEDLLKPRHPFYETSEIKAWVAIKDKKPIARIMAIINHRYNDYHNQSVGFIGFFDFPNDLDIAQKLINHAEKFFMESGIDKIIGPVNPSTNYECGLLIKGFEDPPQIMMPYNHAYYDDIYSSLGFKKAKDLLAYQFMVDKGMPEVIQKIAKRTEVSQKVNFREVSFKNWDRDINIILNIYNEAWEKNWGFVPMTDKEFFHMAREMKQILDPKLALIANVNDEPAGFILTLPDYNQLFKLISNGKLLPWGLVTLLTQTKKINRVRTLTLGVREKFRRKGLETLLYLKSWEAAKARGMQEAEFSWVLEDNEAMNRPILKMGATPYKTYRLYEK